MSVQNTNSAKYMEYHGIKLAGGAQIANLVVEKLGTAPATLEAGRFWYNTANKVFQFVRSNGTELVVENVSTASELAAALNALNANLASTAAGKGTGLVGFSGATGTNGKFSVAAGTTEDSLKSIVSAVDAEIKNRQDEGKADRDALAAASGAGLVGYDGKTGTNGVIVVAAGTVEQSLDSIITQADAKFSEMGDDKLSKSTLVDQSVASKVTFASDVVINGDISVLGDKNRIEGNVVELGDNIILLNREVLADATPVADAGLSVNRGIKGELDFIIWSEANKYVTAPVVTVDPETKEETVVQSRVILGVEFDKFDKEVTDRLKIVEDQVNGKIGDLTKLHTDAKDSLVNAINEVQDELDTYKANVADNAKGASLVGFAGKAGVNNLLVVAAGTVKAALESIVTFADAEAKAADDYISDVAATTAGKGGSLVGFVGQGAAADKFYLPAGTVSGSIASIVTAVKEDRESIASTDKSIVDLKAAINAQSFKAVSNSALSHTIAHGLNSLDVNVGLWIKDGSSWVNHQAYTKIVDANTIEVTLTTAAEIKVLVKKFEDLV